MNRVILMGRLTRDPEVRYTQGERSMLLQDILLRWTAEDAVTRTETSRLPILLTSWHLTEQVSLQRSIFVEGMRVLVSGRIQTGSYTNKEGQRVYTTDIIADDQEFADSKNASAGGNRHQKWESRSVMALCQYRMA